MNESVLNYQLPQLLNAMVENGASDLHITVGTPPVVRIDGEMIPLKLPPLTAPQTKELCYAVLNEEQKVHFEKSNEIDFAFPVKNLSRFRANVFIQRGAIAGVFRQIPFHIRTLAELGTPPVVADLCTKPRGLVLVTGPTGSGKSTTLAAMIDKINSEQRSHIVTIEDPVEFVHQHKLSIINQREVGADTHGFKEALKSILRQDPDIVLLGELRDRETIEAALTIAETGHLVFSTLHTNSAITSINRIIDVFPPHQQGQIRAQLSFSLIAVMTQQLLPKLDGKGRCLCAEIMIPNAAIRNLIREDKLHQVYSQMQMGQADSGMQTMNQALFLALQQQFISVETAYQYSQDVDELKAMVEGRAKSKAARQ